MTASVTEIGSYISGAGRKEVYLDVIPGAYSLDGIAVDLSSYFSTRIHSVSIDGMTGGQKVFWCEPTIVSRTDLETGLRLYFWRSANTVYDNDSAAALGVAVYADHDATGEEKQLVVSAGNSDIVHGEQKKELDNSYSLTDLVVRLTVVGD